MITPDMALFVICCSGLATITSQEVSCYSISAKNQVNIDITIEWLIKQAKKKRESEHAA